MNIQPKNDYILVKMDDDVEHTSGGLLKPDGAYESILRTGVVVDVGPGLRSKKSDKHLALDISKGEGVVFNRFIASSTKTAESLHLFALEENEALIRENDVLLAYDRSEPPEFV